jgi:DNA-binding transcriptional MerR regulator
MRKSGLGQHVESGLQVGAGQDVGAGLQVGEVARSAGLTVRTLHHWDSVGLLVPSGRTAAGYRVYLPQDLERLVRVLSYRELGFGLEEVRRLLDDEVDATASLCRQHQLLVDRIERLRHVAALVHTTMEARRMGIELTAQEVREVFGDEDPTVHAQEAEQRWGDTDAYRQSQQRTSTYSKQDWLRLRQQQDDLEERFAAALRRGIAPDAPEAGALAEEHRRFLSEHFYDVSPEMHRNLADMYVEDERFQAHYDRRQPGLARYVHDAVHAAGGQAPN